MSKGWTRHKIKHISHNTVMLTGLDSFLTTSWAQRHLTEHNPHGTMKWMGEWEAQDYRKNDVVRDGTWTMIANADTSDRAGPQPIGTPAYAYKGTPTTPNVTAKQVIFGQRYTAINSGYMTGYRVYTVTGNRYTIYRVDDPLGVAQINQIISITADTDGWNDFAISPAIFVPGDSFDLLAIVQEPDPTVTTLDVNYNYTKPNIYTVPIVGQVNHANRDANIMSFNDIDDDAVDRSAALLSLVAGDKIKMGGQEWSVQSVADMGAYVDVEVAPAIQSPLLGVQTFTLETVTATPITYMFDLDYWQTQGITNVQGLFGADTDYGDIVPDNSAYGVDLLLQDAAISPDWDLVSTMDGGTSGGQTVNLAGFNDNPPFTGSYRVRHPNQVEIHVVNGLITDVTPW